MKKNYFLLSMLSLLFICFTAGCNDSNIEEPTQKSAPAKLEVLLTDAPSMYDAVNIEILGISVHVENEDNAAWHDFELIKPEIHNLLAYQNGNSRLLIKDKIVSGKISQIRLILGNNNTVVVDGKTYDLTTPSAQQSGLKLNMNEVLLPDETYRLWIDFNAGKSIHQTGNGKYMLKPVLRAFIDTNTGTLGGHFTPAEVVDSVQAILGTDTLTTYVDDKGFFLFVGLIPSDDWKLRFFVRNPERYNSLNTILSAEGEALIEGIEVEKGADSTISFRFEPK